MKGYADLADTPEDRRITIIGQEIMKRPDELIAVCVDSDAGKMERYIAKITSRFPDIEVVDTFEGPVEGVKTIRLRQKEPR